MVARAKGGRPIQSTDKLKNQMELTVVALKNEVPTIYEKEKKQIRRKKRLPNGRLTEIIAEV